MSNARILELVEIFSDLTPRQLEAIYKICKEQIYSHGAFIVEESMPSQDVYVILEGEVEVVVDPKIQRGSSPRQLQRIAVLQKGQSFGEVALVDQGLRSASVRCLSETCRVFTINREDFMNLLKKDLAIGFTVMSNLAADLCLKIRHNSFMMRERLLYTPHEEND